MPTATEKEGGSGGGRKPRADQKRAKKVASAVLDAPAVLDATAVEDELSEDGAFASISLRAACRWQRARALPRRGAMLLLRLRELALTSLSPFFFFLLHTLCCVHPQTRLTRRTWRCTTSSSAACGGTSRVSPRSTAGGAAAAATQRRTAGKARAAARVRARAAAAARRRRRRTRCRTRKRRTRGRRRRRRPSAPRRWRRGRNRTGRKSPCRQRRPARGARVVPERCRRRSASLRLTRTIQRRRVEGESEAEAAHLRRPLLVERACTRMGRGNARSATPS